MESGALTPRATAGSCRRRSQACHYTKCRADEGGVDTPLGTLRICVGHNTRHYANSDALRCPISLLSEYQEMLLG